MAHLTSSTGPLEETIKDFWRMVWEYKLPTIVMLTETVEAGRVRTLGHLVSVCVYVHVVYILPLGRVSVCVYVHVVYILPLGCVSVCVYVHVVYILPLGRVSVCVYVHVVYILPLGRVSVCVYVHVV